VVPKGRADLFDHRRVRYAWRAAGRLDGPHSDHRSEAQMV